MKYIGVVRTDDLPSTSIGLRVSEMNRLKFDAVILYAKTRITVAKQFKGCRVVTSEKQLMSTIEEIGPSIVVIDSRCHIDRDAMKALGVPSDNEARCLVGSKIVESKSIGDRNIVKVFEYDRRKNVARYPKNDSGPIAVDSPDTKGPIVMNSSSFMSMLCYGDSFLSGGEPFRDVSDSIGMSITCADPADNGIKWSSMLSGSEKIPQTIVCGEHKKPAVRLCDRRQDTCMLKNDIVHNATDVGAASPKKLNTDEGASSLPMLSVLFQTHNRTATACFCLNTLLQNLEYSGGIHWCICDDRSDPGHVEALVSVLVRNGANSYSLHYTDAKRYGLGASMNNGLKWSFKFTDVVLTAEDDFMLREKFDITPYVAEIMKPDVSMIKLASITVGYNPVFECGHRGFLQCGSNRKRPHNQWYTFNNLVALRHKRVFDAIGMYAENCRPEAAEIGMLSKFNSAYNAGFSKEMKILWPAHLDVNTYETRYFVHIGKSTIGHKDTPSVSKYAHLADPALDEKIRKEAISSYRCDLAVVVPCHNSYPFIKRCLDSIDRQTYGGVVRIAVVDDDSDSSHAEGIRMACSGRKNLSLMPMHDNKCAGGARNYAVEKLRGIASYIMFLDSDDEFIGTDSLDRVASTIKSNNYPDMVCLGYIGSDGKERIAKASSFKDRMAVAPWSRCTKSERVQPFEENRRMCNDTMQYLRTIDTVQTVASVPGPVVRYNSDNPESCWHSGSARRNRKAMEGMFMTVMDILFSKFERAHTSEEAKASVKYIMKNLNNSVAEVYNGQ